MIVADRTQQPKGMGVQFEGTEGWIWVERDGLDASPKSLLTSVIGPEEIHLPRSDDHHQNFLDCVRSRAETITPARIAHRSIMIGHLGLIAMKLGRKVQWDPGQNGSSMTGSGPPALPSDAKPLASVKPTVLKRQFS